MPLKSPYPARINADEGTGLRIQFDIDPKDKSDIIAIWPTKGTIQLILLNLVHNLANDLRKLNIHGYQFDGSDILDILTSHRPLSDDLAQRLGRTSVGIAQTISSGLCGCEGGGSVCEKTPRDTKKSSDLTKRTAKRKSRARDQG